MNYHDCFDSFVCFWLPVTIIYNRHKHYQQHRHLIKKWISNTCSPMFPNHFFQLQRLVSSSHFADIHLGKDVAFAQKNRYFHSPSMTTLPRPRLSFKSKKLNPKNYATPSGRTIE